MNLLLIESDQQRWDTIGAGSIAKTPNLDRLAERGVTFTNCCCNSPLCGPSRASSATGRWAHEAGCFGNFTVFDGRIRTYAHVLADNGVTAADIGRMDFLSGCDHGFDAILEHPRQERDVLEFLRRPMAQRVGGYRTYCWDTEILDEYRHHGPVEEICDWLEEHAGDTKPWHLFTNFNLPHPPFRVPRKFFEMYDMSETPLPELPQGYLESQHEAVKLHRHHWNVESVFPPEDIRYKRTIYYAMTTWLDAMVGIVLEKLDQLGLSEETLVIFTSDHGENLGDHGLWSKGCFYDTACRVPLIIAGESLPKGTTADSPVSLIDLAPTILDSFGISSPEETHGKSLLPVARGDSCAHPGVAFGEYHGHDAVSGQFMVRTGRYKYIHHVAMPPQLFDLEADPGEMNDLGGDGAFACVAQEMEALLRGEFNPEEIDREARRYQAESFKAWRAAEGPEQVAATLRELLGERQYRSLREHYGC